MCSLGEEWHISAAGNEIITENNSIKDRQKILNLALNSDLREICDPVLSTELPKDLISKIVLQIQKIRNISAPKANEESQAAPRMLKLSLTDGDTFIQALETSPINAISRNRTPPGSKVLINNAKIVSGYVLLNANNCTLLGGKVPHLVEKWELAKSITRTNRRTSGEDGPPPWVNFGTKIQTGNQEGSFTSLGKSKDSKENSEFEMQRQGAIAEATTGATRKVFGGRVKQNIQSNLGNGPQNKSADRRDHVKSKSRNVSRDQEVEEKPSKPSEKVSLFSFLEDKLPVPEISKHAEYSENVSMSQNKNDEFKRNGNQNLNYYNSRQYSSQSGSYERPYHNNKMENRRDDISNQRMKTNSQFSKPSYNNNSSYNQNSYNQNSTQSSNKRTDEHAPIVGNQEDKLLQNKKISNANPPRNDHQNKLYDKDKNSSHKQYGSSYQPRSENNDSSQNNLKRNDKPFNNQQKQTDQGKWYVNPNIPQNNQGNQSQVNSDKRNEKVNSSYKTSTTQSQKKANNINDASKPEKDLQQTVNGSNSTNMSINSQFASRSLRQHLNLGSVKKSEEVVKEKCNADKVSLNIGDEILAKYWEDGKFYNATITAVTDKTYAVKFKGYGNIEEIFKHDCLPVQNNIQKPNNNYRQNRQYGSMEFRRSNRNYNN